MKSIYYIIITIFFVCLLSSCVVTKKVNYLQEPGGSIPEYETDAEFEDYKLQKGDYLFIRVTTINPEESEMFNGDFVQRGSNTYNSDNAVMRLYMYLIDEEGMINYPYIDKIKVEGLTVREVKLLVEEKTSVLVSDPTVEVRLANRSFSVIGETGTGRYQIPKEKLTIYEALAMCGDLDMYADRKNIQLIRETPEGTIVKTFDVRSKDLINSEFYYIQPNDVIYVPFSNDRYWGASHFTSIFSITFSTLSFGLLIYSVVDTIIKAAK